MSRLNRLLGERSRLSSVLCPSDCFPEASWFEGVNSGKHDTDAKVRQANRLNNNGAGSQTEASVGR